VADSEGASRLTHPLKRRTDAVTHGTSDNVTVLWRHYYQFISSNMLNMINKILKIIATSSFLADLECMNFVFGWSLALLQAT